MKQNYLRRTLSAAILFLASALTWAYDFEADGIYYNITGDATVEVTSGDTPYSGNIVIPSTAIFNEPGPGIVQRVVNVTGIGDEAFAGCSSLTSVDIPGSVKRIGKGAFSGCTSLNAVVCRADEVPELGADVFLGVPTDEATLYVPGEAHIYDRYKETEQLKEFGAFQTLGNYDAGIFVAKGIRYVINADGTTVSVTDNSYNFCSGDIVIPSMVKFKDKSYSVTSIGEWAFSWCTDITSMVIPESVTSIEAGAFHHCSSLASINIPDGVTSIGDNAFYWCTSLTSIVIPDDVTSIGAGAFYQCSSLESIVIPESVTSIGEDAFVECRKLASVKIGNGVESIGAGAFTNCTSLTSVNIPNGLKSIEGGFFYGCSSLTSIIIPESVTSIEYSAFYGCGSLEFVNIPDSVTSIGDDAFSGCSSLASIVIPENVTFIGQGAFNWCSSLESIDLPESVTSIRDYTFSHCRSLTSIELPESLTSIESSAFSECSSLTSINIPDGVTSIGGMAFYGCSSLTSIDIPESVTNIGYSAFEGCSSLTTVICRAENVPELGSVAFYGVPKNRATLYVPASALEDYKAADQWKDFFRILSLDDRVLDYALREGWNTIVLPWSTDLEPFGEGAKAYAFTGAEDGTLSFSTVDHLEANTPYIIYATEAQDDLVFYNVTDCSFSADPSVEHNGVTFRGTYEDIDAPDMQGKYGIADDARIRRGSELAYIKAYHAYFEAAAGAEVKAISFDGDDATGIIEIADALQQDVQYYNLAGQRTQKPQKGVNIVGGKKVLY